MRPQLGEKIRCRGRPGWSFEAHARSPPGPPPPLGAGPSNARRRCVDGAGGTPVQARGSADCHCRAACFNMPNRTCNSSNPAAAMRRSTCAACAIVSSSPCRLAEAGQTRVAVETSTNKPRAASRLDECADACGRAAQWHGIPHRQYLRCTRPGRPAPHPPPAPVKVQQHDAAKALPGCCKECISACCPPPGAAAARHAAPAGRDCSQSRARSPAARSAALPRPCTPSATAAAAAGGLCWPPSLGSTC